MILIIDRIIGDSVFVGVFLYCYKGRCVFLGWKINAERPWENGNMLMLMVGRVRMTLNIIEAGHS